MSLPGAETVRTAGTRNLDKAAAGAEPKGRDGTVQRGVSVGGVGYRRGRTWMADMNLDAMMDAASHDFEGRLQVSPRT